MVGRRIPLLVFCTSLVSVSLVFSFELSFVFACMLLDNNNTTMPATANQRTTAAAAIKASYEETAVEDVGETTLQPTTE